jgi:hypothetical protein
MAIPILLIFFFGCQKEALKDELVVSAAKGSGGGGTGNLAPVYLKVTVMPGYKIIPDPKVEYIHGVDGVAAYFDQYGNFIFDTYTGMARNSPVPAKRWLKFLFDAPLSGTAYGPFESADGSYRMVTLLNGGPALQNLAGDADPQLVSLGGGFRKPKESTAVWNFSFRYNAENTTTSQTNYAKVTRTGANEWTVTGEVANPICALRTAGSTTPTYYYLPFELKLTKLP